MWTGAELCECLEDKWFYYMAASLHSPVHLTNMKSGVPENVLSVLFYCSLRLTATVTNKIEDIPTNSPKLL